MSHKPEWDAFVRSAANRKKFPVALAETFNSQKVELFNMWLDSGKDWNRTQLLVERQSEMRNQSIKGWTAVQGKALKQQYGDDEAKFQTIVAKRKASGLYYEDEDFPGDDLDTWC